MPRNGSGVYTAPQNSWNPAVNGAQALPADWMAILQDLVAAMTQSTSADGQTLITGVWNFGNNRITGVGAPVGTGNALRWEQMIKGADIASDTTISIPIEGSIFNVTGTTTITSFDDVFPGRCVLLRFDDSLQITHSSSLQMPGGVNITTKTNDVGLFVNSQSGVWQCIYFTGAAPVQVASLNGGQLAGFRNKILNGRFTLNQSGSASRIATPNAYNFDQWYYDGTYLYQPIPTEDVQDGTYTLSWEGDSTAAWSLNSEASVNQGAQTYTSIPNGGQIVVSGHTNEHLWVRFQGDLLNLDKVQLEPGGNSTPFEERPFIQELALCQYFYERGEMFLVDGYIQAAANTGSYVFFKVDKRTVPTILQGDINHSTVSGSPGNAAASGTGFLAFRTNIGATGPGQFHEWWTASARI